MKERLKKMDLHALLETIQANLAFNIDSIYSQAKELIGNEKEHNLGWKKEDLKRQIEGYLKTIIQNITNYIEKSYKSYNPFIQPHINLVKKSITNYLEEAIEIRWKIKGNYNNRECTYHTELNGEFII